MNLKSHLATDLPAFYKCSFRSFAPGCFGYRFILSALLLLVSDVSVAALTMRPANPYYPNEFGIGVSYGWKTDKNADFVGFAPDYTRTFGQNWLINFSFAYDEETERKEEKSMVVESWTPSMVLGYQLNTIWAVGVGLGHGLYQRTSNSEWEKVKWGDDLNAALATAVSLWNRDRHAISLSMAYEYGFSDNEPSISLDIGYGFGF